MPRSFRVILVLALAVALSSVFVGSPAATASPIHRTARASIPGNLFVPGRGGQPLSFEVNRGQAAAAVRFLVHTPDGTLFLTRSAALLALSTGGRQSLLGLLFLGANLHPQVTGSQRLPGIVNYFLGNDPHMWHTDIPTYARVTYHSLYPGIDLVYHSRGGQLEYDWVVHPGANPSRIRLGGAAMALDGRGNLLLGSGRSRVVHTKPLVYQQIRGQRVVVRGQYLLHRGVVGVQVGRYDATRPLVIDPYVISFSTYLGGSGNDQGNGVATDGSGNVYVTGFTQSSNFPVTNTSALKGSEDAFVTKFDPTGALLYSTYLGGSSLDYGRAIAVDGSGNAYITGFTRSSDFPTMNAYEGMLDGGNSQCDGPCGDAFVTKLDPSGAMVYSTYLGGGSSDYGYGIAVDGTGNAYVTGETLSRDFPVTNGSANHGSADVFVSKLGPGGNTLLFSTYLGGSSNDYGYGIAVDGSGNAYVTGTTESSNFPVTNGSTLKGVTDAFVTEINTMTGSTVYSTYVGGSNYDYGQGIAVDGSGNAYITGYTTSTDFPVTNGSTLGGSQDAIVVKLDPTGHIAYSTYLGGSGADTGSAIALDPGIVYVTGATMSTDFPVSHTNHTSLNGSSDAFVTVLDPSANGYLFSTYLGGSGDEIGYGIAVDPSGNIAVTGVTSSSDFPTQNAHQSTFGGSGGCEGICGDAFVTSFSPLPTAARVSTFTARRAGGVVRFRWRIASGAGIAAFNLYAAQHRLNRQPIGTHAGRTYGYRTAWRGGGPFTLQVILTNGGQVRVTTTLHA